VTQPLRVAALQYFIRPVDSFESFAAQVSAVVATAADYKARLVVFPEYFTVQLLTLDDTQKPIREQVRGLASQVPRFVDLMATLARRHGLYVVAGSIPGRGDNGELHNDSHVFAPSGNHAHQGKLHMTRWESEEWQVAPRRRLHIFETDFGRMAVTICYDVEFPEIARAAARMGCDVLAVPSCTDDRHGFLRVRYCAQSRAIENQLYVVHACTVGSLPMVPAVSMNYGQASILTPSDFRFSRDGILAEGQVNSEMMILGDLDLDLLRDSRERGTVLPLRDSRSTADVLADLVEVRL
jgi:predicted amidohydrolase